jgi:hypothetical protein
VSSLANIHRWRSNRRFAPVTIDPPSHTGCWRFLTGPEKKWLLAGILSKYFLGDQHHVGTLPDFQINFRTAVTNTSGATSLSRARSAPAFIAIPSKWACPETTITFGFGA